MYPNAEYKLYQTYKHRRDLKKTTTGFFFLLTKDNLFIFVYTLPCYIFYVFREMYHNLK